MSKIKPLVQAPLLALAVIAVEIISAPFAQAVSITPEQLQSELNSLQRQIYSLKAQQAQINKQRAALAAQAKEQAAVTQQQAAVAVQQARVVRQQRVTVRLANSGQQNSYANRSGILLDTKKKALLLPDNITISLNGVFGAWGANMSSDVNTVGRYKLNPIVGDAYAVLVPSVNFKASDSTNFGLKSVLWISQSSSGVGSNENASITQGTPAFVVHFLYGYMRNKHYGTINIGQEPGTFTFMEVGNTNLDGGGWDAPFSGGLANVVPGAVRPYYLHGTTNSLDSTLKVAYISPRFDGFFFGVSFEPNANGIKEGTFSCAVASSGCAALSSSPSITDIGRKRKNTVDATLEYTGTFGASHFSASAGILYGSPVSYSGPPTSGITQYKPLKVERAGAQFITPLGSGRFILNGNMEFGQVEDFFAFEPKGAPNAFEYTVGAAYLIDRWKAAGSYFSNRTSGFYNPKAPVTGRYELETGSALELAYSMTHNWKILLNYLYGTRQQAGYDFITSSDGKNNNHVKVQLIGFGTQFKW